MSDNAVIVESLSKRYLLGHQSGAEGTYKYSTFRDAIGREVRNFARKASDLVHGLQIVQGDETEEFRRQRRQLPRQQARFWELLVAMEPAKAHC